MDNTIQGEVGCINFNNSDKYFDNEEYEDLNINFQFNG